MSPFGGVVRNAYGEGKAERPEMEAAGEHARVEGIDGGNIWGSGGEWWEVPGLNCGHGS